MSIGYLWGIMKRFGIKTRVVVTQPCEYTKTTELYTLKEQILGYINYISIINYSEIQFSYHTGKNPEVGEVMENRCFQILLVGGQFTNTYKIICESVSFDPVTSLLGMIKVEHCFYVTQCPLSRQWLNAPWPIYTTEYRVAVKHEKRYSKCLELYTDSQDIQIVKTAKYMCIYVYIFSIKRKNINLCFLLRFL